MQELEEVQKLKIKMEEEKKDDKTSEKPQEEEKVEVSE